MKRYFKYNIKPKLILLQKDKEKTINKKKGSDIRPVNMNHFKHNFYLKKQFGN